MGLPAGTAGQKRQVHAALAACTWRRCLLSAGLLVLVKGIGRAENIERGEEIPTLGPAARPARPAGSMRRRAAGSAGGCLREGCPALGPGRSAAVPLLPSLILGNSSKRTDSLAGTDSAAAREDASEAPRGRRLLLRPHARSESLSPGPPVVGPSARV